MPTLPKPYNLNMQFPTLHRLGSTLSRELYKSGQHPGAGNGQRGHNTGAARQATLFPPFPPALPIVRRLNRILGQNKGTAF